MATKAKLETADRMLQLLECFSDAKTEWGVTELSEELGLYKSVVYRILSTLEGRGYVQQNPENKKYSLGLRLFELGMLVGRQMNVRTLAKPEIDKLAGETGETVLLMIVDGLYGVCIEKMESGEAIKSTSQLGKRVPLYAGAPTRVLMAYLPEEQIDAVIDAGLVPFTNTTLADADKLKADLARIRESGYCWSFGEMDLGSMGIAFPIRNHEEQVVASIAVLGPQFRMEHKQENCQRRCAEAAREISAKLGSKYAYPGAIPNFSQAEVK